MKIENYFLDKNMAIEIYYFKVVIVFIVICIICIDSVYLNR